MLFFKRHFPQFHRVPMKRRIDDALYEARKDALDAAGNAEYWVAHSDMLKQRVERLEDEQARVTAVEGVPE